MCIRDSPRPPRALPGGPPGGRPPCPCRAACLATGVQACATAPRRAARRRGKQRAVGHLMGVAGRDEDDAPAGGTCAERLGVRGQRLAAS
eukprot:11994317-Alexandrium_andersonii.AAC.1